jgi:hypothetical protein
MGAMHRVALELEVEEDPEQAEPEDWDLQHLIRALRTGLARPVRTIRGLVVDPDGDRLSNILEAIANDIEEAVELHWLASMERPPKVAIALLPRASLDLLVELDRLARSTRRVADRLQREGL